MQVLPTQNLHISVKPGKEVWHKWTTACAKTSLILFPVVWHWKSHLIINTELQSPQKQTFFYHLWLYEKSQDWRKCTQRHNFYLFFYVSFEAWPFQKLGVKKLWAFLRKHTSLSEKKWKVCAQHMSVLVERDVLIL